MFGLFRLSAIGGVTVIIGIPLLGCGEVPMLLEPASPSDSDGAAYLGSATCLACHPVLVALHGLHGHGQALKRSRGASPTYPAGAASVGVPAPPAGFGWFDISFVIGGYTKSANFVDAAGYVLTDGTAGTLTQYNLKRLPTQTQADFVSFRPDQVSPLPYDYACFRCHTTGAASVDANGGFRQGNRPGIGGTWAEEGVQCESCHGPGSRHLGDPSAGNIVVDATSASCSHCHGGFVDPTVLEAADGFIVGNQQFSELEAGPHHGFTCTICHDPHASVIYDPDNGLRNTCRSCHTDTNMAFHQGHVFVQGDYVEWLSCESCHMPLASKNASSVSSETMGRPGGRIGDTRTHVLWIDTTTRDYSFMFSDDGTEVVMDDQGKAAVTLDFVCLRCHNGLGNAFELALPAASAIAEGIHESP